MFYKRSFPLLKDVIAVFRSDVKRRCKIRIIIINSLERNILYTSFISSVVHYIATVSISSIENIALICRFIS